MSEIITKPTIIELEPYGDHRDAKSSTYDETIDWSYIIHNLTVEDAKFILSQLYKNILWGEAIADGNKGYTHFASYTVWHRGTEVWATVHLTNEQRNIDWKTFHIKYDTESHMMTCDIGVRDCNTSGSAYILIYEYFKNKKPSKEGTINIKTYLQLLQEQLTEDEFEQVDYYDIIVNDLEDYLTGN